MADGISFAGGIIVRDNRIKPGWNLCVFGKQFEPARFGERSGAAIQGYLVQSRFQKGGMLFEHLIWSWITNSRSLANIPKFWKSGAC